MLGAAEHGQSVLRPLDTEPEAHASSAHALKPTHALHVLHVTSTETQLGTLAFGSVAARAADA